jgi:lactoylglutathione lyase
VITRPENNSQFCYIHDPDHTMIELVFHARRPYPPVPEKYATAASAGPGAPGAPGGGGPGGSGPGVTGPGGVAPESAEQAQAALTAADNAAVK